MKLAEKYLFGIYIHFNVYLISFIFLPSLFFFTNGELFTYCLNNIVVCKPITYEIDFSISKIYLDSKCQLVEMGNSKVLVGAVLLKLINLKTHQIELIISLKKYAYSLSMIDSDTIISGTNKGLIKINLSDKKCKIEDILTTFDTIHQIIVIGHNTIIVRNYTGSINIIKF